VPSKGLQNSCVAAAAAKIIARPKAAALQSGSLVQVTLPGQGGPTCGQPGRFKSLNEDIRALLRQYLPQFIGNSARAVGGETEGGSMNKLTRILLSGAALSALAAAPAIAHPKHPAFRVTAMHAGHAVNKTKLHNPGACRHCTTYTFAVYSYQPASAPKKTHLVATYYRWNSYSTLCSNPKQRVTVPKRSVYAKIGTATETYSFGCPSGPTTFYGDLWTNKTGVAGNVDLFVSTLIGKFRARHGGEKYKGTLPLDVSVFIQ
jgi:hypothetical protein